MEKIKPLLLPLALVFAAIAVFEFGARYGATNMRAYAIASELQFPLNIFAQNKANMDNSSKEYFAMMIDKGIAAGAMHRQIWYLARDAQAALDSLLSYALKVRGDAVTERYASMEASEDITALNQTKLEEIREALAEAKLDLIDKAPKVAEQEAE
ncbi:MAG: hypothetical protein DBX01_06900 [Puniceicoccaceae bacterium]|nr:MAG: hypothetical protein DBX01_06900 [Puniceicoccaceae bacterium]|tara:strand:- start:164 stop:628 length:465 start_codon:yes stop_codon:yes gene_type:complete